MTRARLSTTMAAALADTHDRGGVLMRQPGGFWTKPGEPYTGSGYAWWINTPTVQALVIRGLMEYTEWKEGRNGRFPVQVKLVEKLV